MIVSRIRVRLLTWARVRPAWCRACARVSPMGTPRLHCSAAAPIAPAGGAGGTASSLPPCPPGNRPARRGSGSPCQYISPGAVPRTSGRCGPRHRWRRAALLGDLDGGQRGRHLGRRGVLADAETGQHALAILLFKHGEKYVLGPDVVMAHTQGLTEREFQYIGGFGTAQDKGGHLGG